jgi:predicted DNA-binding transcriptional regulator AlpA
MTQESLELLRFADLKRLGVCRDRATLRRWLKAKTDPFPSAIILSGNAIAWRAAEVRDWLDRRPRGPAPQPRHLEAERRAAEADETVAKPAAAPARRRARHLETVG